MTSNTFKFNQMKPLKIMNEKNRKTLLIQTYFVYSKNTSGNFFLQTLASVYAYSAYLKEFKWIENPWQARMYLILWVICDFV